MKYPCGTEVMLDDEIMVEHGPGQKSLARVVAIGVSRATPDIDRSFYDWAKDKDIINGTSVVVEWLGTNPLAHNDPNFAPVGKYMTLSSVSSETFLRRGKRTSPA